MVRRAEGLVGVDLDGVAIPGDTPPVVAAMDENRPARTGPRCPWLIVTQLASGTSSMRNGDAGPPFVRLLSISACRRASSGAAW
ncbi:hypothetical protein AUC70_09340 [Methyloceanibacter stevinii]|uniref:Uncharacterized protein n=1 Tax=Methyloceanibacter stevinii TaxID=1774970 RepID=A0A1E3VKL6_9HYPH|nr:hypothetical protein [Methyloceanibacter stevinii]ODR93831.1 hypothetical protein AUC70_09340 [Methyloceanibacter stevinii]